MHLPMRSGTVSNVPKEPMKNRVIRVSDSVWEAAKTRADERNESVSDAVRKFLERYAR